MKKLINAVDDVIKDQLAGMAKAYPDITVNLNPNYVYRTDAPNKKVALVSGGGSGHEPMHTGFVGLGMLDGACPGQIFTSPTPDQIYACAKAVATEEGVLFIVKNYTGDVMNFETAIEMVHGDGIKVQNVLIDDDVAVKDSLFTAGRRGVGTTVLVEKIVGAAAETGYSLTQCADLARRVSQNGRSMGVALTSCTVPAAGKPTFELADDEVEMGIGIHGEPGTNRIKMQTVNELTEHMAMQIIQDKAYTRTIREWHAPKGEWEEKSITSEPLKSGDEVIAFVNSMGGTPISELYLVYDKLVDICRSQGIKIVRNLIGPYITALDMQGCAITLLKTDPEILKFWDAPVKTPCLRRGV
nr:dihydroxyacetone kinase subunit DhaK [uncultured Desulfobacter sp.]